MSDIYQEQPTDNSNNETVIASVNYASDDFLHIAYNDLANIVNSGVDLRSGIVYIDKEFDDELLTSVIIRTKAIVEYRSQAGIELETPINYFINSPGGDIYVLLGIIDYIQLLPCPVNTIVRGTALSAAAILLACGTGARVANESAHLMLHDCSIIGLDATRRNLQSVSEQTAIAQRRVYELLSEKTNKPAAFWEETMSRDFYFTAQQGLELRLIDQIR